MNIFQVLMVFVLCGARPGLNREPEQVHTVTEGRDVRVECPFNTSGKKRIFCKNECNQADYLVETTANTRNNGSYAIAYKRNSSESYSLFVSIKKVRRSDSGKYQCVLENEKGPAQKYRFNIRVTQDSFFTPTPGSSPEQQKTTPLSGVLLYVGLGLTAVIALSVTLLILCSRKRAKRPREPPEAPEYAEIAECSRVYEDIPFDSRQSRGAPVEMSSVSFSNTTPSCDIYSLCAAPTEPQTDDLSSLVSYSDLDFSKCSSAPQSPTAQTEETALYSTVALPQQ